MCMTKKLNVWAVAVATVFAAAVLPREVSAQDASNGYRLWNFTSTIKGTALNCIGCHGQDPYNPPNAMLPGVNIATACNMAWPAGTAHALKTLCVIGEATATQAQAFSVVDGAINGQSLMSQFRTPLSPAERADLAAFLLASLKRTAVPFARPEFQQQGSTTPIGTLNFGSVNDGATSSQVVYFVNSGTLAMQIGPGFAAGASVSGLNQTRYTVTTVVPSGETACTASMQLPVGARCGLTVSFSPDLSVPQGALQTATLTIPSNGGSGVSQLNLNGARTVIAAPTLTLTPSATDLNAGTTAAGTSLNFAPITVRNNGTVALNIATITLGGANAADFTRATGGTNCADGGSVAPNGTCVLQFAFAPQAGATGTRTATVDIASNATSIPVRLTLSGTVGTATPVIAFGTTSNSAQAFLRLQSAAAGSAVNGVVTVRNVSAAGGPALNISSVALSAGSPTFAIRAGTTDCLAAPVPAGGNCTIEVTYTPPDTAVPHTGNILITSNGRTGGAVSVASPHSVALEGTVVIAGSGMTSAVALDSRNMRFENTPVNALSRQSERVTIRNTGSSALTVQARLNSPQSDFAVVNGCTSVAVGSTCFVDVQFRPRSEGARTDTLTLAYNGGSLPAMTLSGTGQAASTAGVGSGGGAVPPLWLLALLAGGLALSARRRH
jgi:hypothetical protein